MPFRISLSCVVAGHQLTRTFGSVGYLGYNVTMTDMSLIELVDIECDSHNPDGCICDNGVLTVLIDHDYDPEDPDYWEGDWEPDYETIWREREEARYERYLERLDRIY